MHKKNKQDMYLYQYIVIFLIYIRNTIKYCIGLEEKKIKLSKIHPTIKSYTVHDEETGICYLDNVFIFNQNKNNLVGQYMASYKQKQD